MKALFLISVCIIACSISAMGQSRFQIQPDGSMKFKKLTPYTFPLNPKGKLDVPFVSKNLSGSHLNNNAYSFGWQVQDKLKDLAAMPVLKPKGRYNMPVYKPDSSIQFTLLIKDYNRVQDKDLK